MDWLEPVAYVLGLALTFAIGKVQQKPGYTKGKNVIATISKALEDDQLTAAEIKEIYALFKKQEEPA